MSARQRSLAGLRVLVTRGAEDCAEWAERLAAHGAIPVLLPCIRTEPIDTPALRDALGRAVRGADWLVLTSARGVAAFASLAGRQLPPRTRVAAVGEATAAAARQAFGRCDLIGAGTAERLGDALAAELQRDAGGHRKRGRTAESDPVFGAHVVLAVAANAGTVLADKLERAGARCERFDVYRTVPAPVASPKRALSSLEADNVVFASPSAVMGFVQQVNMDTAAAIYTIGPSTTAAARATGLAVTAEARTPSFEGVLEAMQWRN